MTCRRGGWVSCCGPVGCHPGRHRKFLWERLQPRALALAPPLPSQGREPELATDSAFSVMTSAQDRKGLVQGKCVSVRVDPGGRRTIKNKNEQHHTSTRSPIPLA